MSVENEFSHIVDIPNLCRHLQIILHSLRVYVLYENILLFCVSVDFHLKHLG